MRFDVMVIGGGSSNHGPIEADTPEKAADLAVTRFASTGPTVLVEVTQLEAPFAVLHRDHRTNA